MNLYVKAFILFISVFVPGVIMLRLRDISRSHQKNLLIFSGSFLFSITILEILPDLYHGYSTAIGIFTLVGYFFQLFLEYFSSGVEHGHLYSESDDCHHSRLKIISPEFLLVSLFIHGLLDSVILINPHHCCGHHHSAYGLLMGIVFHKAPAAFALVSVLKGIGKSDKSILIYLIIFALSSPLGLVLGELSFSSGMLSQALFTYLWALSAGSFLHISTTIFFESNSGHSLNKNHILSCIIGVIFALATTIL